MNKQELIWLIDRYGQLYESDHPNEQEINLHIVGSQSAWGTINPPSELMRETRDLDVIPDDYSLALKNRMEWVIGLDSVHDLEYKNAIDVVKEDLIKAPLKWRERVKKEIHTRDSGFKINLYFMNHHDLAVTKLIAGREKDLNFVKEMFRCNLLSKREIKRLINTEIDHLKIPEFHLDIIKKRFESYAKLVKSSSKYIEPSQGADKGV